MKIAFRIDIGNEIGTGHFMRMSALAEAFTELGCICEFFKNEDEPVDYSGFDIIVLDTYQVDNKYIADLNVPGRIVVCYDDNALYAYNCDILLNANLHAAELRFKFEGKTPSLLLGGKYALLRRELRTAAPFVIREKADRVFVCFGGSDLRNITPRVIEALKSMESVRLSVALGALTSCDDEVFALANDNVSVHKTPAAISDLMRQCDIAVTAAGSMVYELAALGMPAITITQADNQSLIAEYMSRNGLMKCVGDWQNVDFNNLGSEVESLLRDASRRKTESNALKKTVDKNGAINAAGDILKYCRNVSVL